MSTYLVHHGIKGQRWGKRNGPPYPLAPSDHSALEKKALRKTNRGESLQKESDPVKTKSFRLSDKQKKALKIGAAVVATALVAYGGYKLYKNGAFDKLADFGHNKLKSLGYDITNLDDSMFDSSFSLDSSNIADCAKNINPSGSRNNCGSCSTATFLNMLGGNFQALPETPEHMRGILSNGTVGKGYDPQKLISCFKGASWSKRFTDNLGNRRKISKDLEGSLLNEGEGAKGLMYIEKIIKTNPPSGHYFAWAVLNGKVNIVEGQPPSAQSSGIVWNTNFFNEIGRLIDPEDGNSGAIYARLDNCEVLKDRLQDLVQSRS